ncbi:LAETG motif-containing sortase-dependent surface protein [Streptomyces sp. URMC 125]|uniref:LAETG motif-containing sortase-dependent surface protein n=1 Tax=Streptomyces sp. URMC 125 TaxID=3423419 RepID=UPI003F1B746A
MKLRRAFAAAAATAVIAPAALMAAPAAYAHESAPAAGRTDEPQTETSAPEPEPEESETEKPAPEPEPEESETEKPAPEPEPEESETEKPGDGDEEEPGDGQWPVDECPVVDEDRDFTTSISDLPAQVAAGSGWKQFSLNVTNRSDTDRLFSQAHVYLAAATETGADAADYVTLQVRGGDGAWYDVSTDFDSLDAGYVGQGSVGAGETVTLQLRLKVDAKAPNSVGIVLGYAFYLNEDNETCSESPLGDVYEFEIIAAGKKPNGNDARPQTGGGKKVPAKPAPVEKDKQTRNLDFDGQLAETGSSSALPMFALAGAAAVALGVGAVYVVRRRGGAGADTSAAA